VCQLTLLNVTSVKSINTSWSCLYISLRHDRYIVSLGIK
jgi:hypothetical protein